MTTMRWRWGSWHFALRGVICAKCGFSVHVVPRRGPCCTWGCCGWRFSVHGAPRGGRCRLQVHREAILCPCCAKGGCGCRCWSVVRRSASAFKCIGIAALRAEGLCVRSEKGQGCLLAAWMSFAKVCKQMTDEDRRGQAHEDGRRGRTDGRTRTDESCFRRIFICIDCNLQSEGSPGN